MKIVLIAVGKIKNKNLSALADVYEKRIVHYHKYELLELESDVDALDKMKPGDYLIACDELGKELTSIEFSRLIDKISLSNKRIIFVIGGAEGLHKEVKSKCNYMLSLSKMTFQHDLARVILLEQIYRASTISKGEPYHK